jgi:hypothetical protein
VSGGTQSDPRRRAAEDALVALGVRCTIEARGNLAVVIPGPGERALADAAVRRAVLTALRPYGFTHAAVEPRDEHEPAMTPDTPIA